MNGSSPTSGTSHQPRHSALPDPRAASETRREHLEAKLFRMGQK